MRIIDLGLKRMIDFWGSLIVTILIAPILIVIALLIKCTSNGPVFLKQDRLGLNGKNFVILKFRTMIVNAEKLGDGLFIMNERDSRITSIGRVLRVTSLDELPQLWNVFIGDMSLVGPRPPVPYHPYKYDDYSDFQRRRFEMKPGMTGLTQVKVRNSVPWDERIVFDVEYIENFSVWLDVKILVLTVVKLIIQDSIYTGEKL